MKIYQSFLLLGTNLGNRKNNLDEAKALIGEHCGKIIKQSSIYQTAAWGFTEQPDFLNQVIQIETIYNPLELIEKLLDIEKQLGRERIVKMGPRLIDIDILLIDDLIVEEKKLQVPHPRMQDRKFVLLPLNEIASNVVHPILSKTISEILKECCDDLEAKKIN